MIASPLDSASHRLNASNVIYVAGAALTVASAMYVLWENRAIAAGKRVKYYLLSEFAVAFAAVASLIGTIGAIHFGNTVSHLKDIDLATYQAQAEVEIAQAKKDAATANQKAQEAKKEAEATEKDNAHLRVDVSNHVVAEKKAESDLAAQTEKVNQFARGIAQQQQGMAQQMQTFPDLAGPQITEIARQLRPYAGYKVSIHMMMDAHAQRFAAELQKAFKLADVEVTGSSVDMGPVYQGVMIGVKSASPAPHPKFADALMNSLHSVGILAIGYVVPNLRDDEVAVYIGPN